MKIIIKIVLLLTFSISCKSGELSKNRSEAEKQVSNNQDSIQATKVVIDDEFLFKVVDNDLSFSYFKSHFDLIEKQVVQNRHNSAVSDTIMIFSNGKDRANFYVSSSNIILQKAAINSQEIVLNDNIKVGASDNVLKRRFNLEDVPDSLIVKDFENSSYFLFASQRGKINNIVYKATYID